MTFDPNVEATPNWGTHIPGRKPEWREHRRESDAKNAYNRVEEGIIYRWRTDQWVTYASKKPAPPKPVVPPKPIFGAATTSRQKELMRVILEKFAEFEKRQQHFYLLQGMSTSHLTLKAIGDMKTLHAFWPQDQVRNDFRHGNIYMLGDDTLNKVQSAIRGDIDKLAKQGWIEKVGNEDERRWRPVKSLKGVTL